MQVQPVYVNQIVLTPDQHTQARKIITNAINGIVHHPDKFDFVPMVIDNVIALASKWFQTLANNNNYKATLPPIKVSFLDKSILTSIFTGIFKVTLAVDNVSYQEFPREQSDSIIPAGLQWSRPQTYEQRSVTCSWYLGNPFITPQAFTIAPLAKQLAEAAYKEEERKIRAMPSDFTLKVSCNGSDATFATHRLKLAAHSAVFFQLFDSGKYKETATGEFIISDHLPETVGAMLDYIYNGELDASLSLTQVLALTKLADQYQVKSLTIACEQYLSDKLDKDFEKIYEVAALYNLKNLLPFCLQHIGVDKTRTQAFIDSITVENFATLYQMAHEHSLSPLLNELTMWKKYNANARGFDFSIEPAAPPEIDINHQPGKD